MKRLSVVAAASLALTACAANDAPPAVKVEVSHEAVTVTPSRLLQRRASNRMAVSMAESYPNGREA